MIFWTHTLQEGQTWWSQMKKNLLNFVKTFHQGQGFLFSRIPCSSICGYFPNKGFFCIKNIQKISLLWIKKINYGKKKKKFYSLFSGTPCSIFKNSIFDGISVDLWYILNLTYLHDVLDDRVGMERWTIQCTASEGIVGVILDYLLLF